MTKTKSGSKPTFPIFETFRVEYLAPPLKPFLQRMACVDNEARGRKVDLTPLLVTLSLSKR